jgi:hypothetical protein
MEREPKQSDEQLFYSAVEKFPYELEPSSITQGTLEAEDDGTVKYAEEYTFEAGVLLNERLMAGGWIELRRDSESAIFVIALFGIARNADWKNRGILRENEAVQGEYDTETQTWKLWINTV